MPSGKASFSFADRLVTQRLRLHERDVSIETESESLALKEQLIANLKERLETAQEQLIKVENMRKSLEKMDDEAQVAYAAARKKDEEMRAALVAEYQPRIEAVNDQLQDIAQREAKANRLNSTYKQHIEIYAEKSETSEAKFDEYMKQRDDKVAEVKAKQMRDAAAIPELQKELAKETELLQQARAEHAEVKAKVDVYLGRFAEIQAQLDASKKTYENAKDDKARLLRTMRAVESDRAMAVKRAEQSKKERDMQYAKVCKLEEQLENLRTVTERLNNTCAALEGSERESGEAAASAAAPITATTSTEDEKTTKEEEA